MYVSAKVAAVAIVILIARPAWGSGDEWRMRPKPAQTSVFQANLTPIINESPLAPTSVRNLPLSTERPGVNGLLASTTWLKGAFSTETEVTANQAISPAADHSTRLTRLAVTGSAGLVRYGMRFRNGSPQFLSAESQSSEPGSRSWL